MSKDKFYDNLFDRFIEIVTDSDLLICQVILLER